MKTSDTIRSNRAELESEIRAAGGTIRGNAATCIFHEDRHASASIHQGEDGAWRLKCFVPTCGFSGDVFDVRAKIQGKDVGEMLKAVNKPESERPRPKRTFPSVESIVQSVARLGRIESTFTYTNPDSGEVEIVQVRYIDPEDGKKKFLPHHAVPGGFILGAPPKPWPIYNRGRVRVSETVVVVEGEKCVHALHALGIVATTSLSGSSSAGSADWTPLAGKKVFIWPDNDDAGVKYARDVVRMLDSLSPRAEVFLFNPAGLDLPPGGDVVDFFATDAGEVWAVLNDGSELVGAETDLQARVHEIIAGKWISLDWPWPWLSSAVKSLFPGTITVLCGDPAASKSFFILQAAHWWHKCGINVALYELEEDRPFHMLRLLAVLAGDWNVLNDKWGRENPELLKLVYSENRVDADSFAPHMDSAPVGVVDYKHIIKWIETKCAAGAQILIIDPITAVATDDRRDREDLAFIVKASSILREYGARLILVTHPRMGANKRPTTTQDDLAGGRAFSRHTQTVLWLHRHDPSESLLCKNTVGQMMCNCNRSLHIAKARNGRGHGWKLGFTLDPTVQFVEHGVVTKPNAPAPDQEVPSF